MKLTTRSSSLPSTGNRPSSSLTITSSSSSSAADSVSRSSASTPPTRSLPVMRRRREWEWRREGGWQLREEELTEVGECGGLVEEEDEVGGWKRLAGLRRRGEMRRQVGVRAGRRNEVAHHQLDTRRTGTGSRLWARDEEAEEEDVGSEEGVIGFHNDEGSAR